MSSNRDIPGPDGPSPLQDAARWAELIAEMRPDAFLVVIASGMNKKLREHCSPEDIWQETLVRAWNAREQQRWQGRVAFRAWLFEIATNLIRDAARRMDALKHGGGHHVKLFSELDSQGSGTASAVLPPASGTPSTDLARTERAASMERGLTSLPPQLEQVVRLHLAEGLTMEAVAQRLDIGVSTAWRRFRKGVKLCSKALSDWNSGGNRA